jgi:hypothetical protein
MNSLKQGVKFDISSFSDLESILPVVFPIIPLVIFSFVCERNLLLQCLFIFLIVTVTNFCYALLLSI